MLKNNPRAVASEVINAGKCNLSCEYCYIPKSDGMDAMHNDIVKFLDSGAFIDKLEDTIGEKLEALALWGTEPTLTLDLFTKHLPELFRRFPNLKKIHFSSNFIKKPIELLNFIKALPTDREGLLFQVQYSIDGPSYITDKTRGLKNATTRIMSNVIECAREISKLDLGLATVRLHGKSTWDEDIIRFYYTHKDELEKYYSFFNDFFLQVDDAITTNDRFIHDRISSPWMAIPGKYTTEDGKMLAEVVKRIHILEKEKKFPAITDYFSYNHRLWRMFYYLHEYLSKPEMFSCSAGDTQFSIDNVGNVHPCHRSFYMHDDRYVESLQDRKNERLANWDVEHFTEGRLKLYKDNHIVHSDDSEYKKARTQYHWCGHHHFARFRIENLRALGRLLANAGQISHVYVEKPLMMDMAAAFIVSCWSCPVEHLLGQSSHQVIPLSQIRLTCNGVFEEMLRRYYELHRAS